MASASGEKSSFKFLSFSTNDQDKEQFQKLKDAASKIEKAIARQKALDELVDYKPAPEETEILNNDNLSLYERLEEVKKKKQEAIEESQKLSNYVPILEEDDISYLEEVDKAKRENEIKQRLELNDALEDMKRKTALKGAIDRDEKLKQELLQSKLGKYEQQKKSIRDKLTSLLKFKQKRTKDEPSDSGRVTRSSTKSKAVPANESASSISNVDTTNAKNSKKSEQSGKRKRDKDDSDNEEKNPEKKKKEDAIVYEQKSEVEFRVMQCIGLLPSHPIITKLDSDSDSDTSKEGDLDHGHMLLPSVTRKSARKADAE